MKSNGRIAWLSEREGTGMLRIFDELVFENSRPLRPRNSRRDCRSGNSQRCQTSQESRIFVWFR